MDPAFLSRKVYHWKLFRQASLNAFCFSSFVSNVFLSRGGLLNTSRRKFIKSKLRSGEPRTQSASFIRSRRIKQHFPAGLCRSFVLLMFWGTIYSSSVSAMLTDGLSTSALCRYVFHFDAWTLSTECSPRQRTHLSAKNPLSLVRFRLFISFVS